MKKAKCFSNFVAMLVVLLFAGCQSNKESCCEMPSATTTNALASTVFAVAPATTPSPSVTPVPKSVFPVRIKAGPSDSLKDVEGNVWLPEQGFVDGDTTERPDLVITNTKTPAIYR